MSVQIRAARVDDIAGVSELLDELYQSDNVKRTDPHSVGCLAAWHEMLAQPGRLVLVADVDGAVVGTVDILVVKNISHSASPWAIADNLFVKHEYRREGIGTALMTAMIKWASDHHCYKVDFLSAKERTGAHAFHETLGFEPLAIGFRLTMSFPTLNRLIALNLG